MIVAVAAGVLVIFYVLYGYRSAHNEVQLKSMDLDEAKKEFKALSKRFDMLSNELKGMLEFATLIKTYYRFRGHQMHLK